MEWNCCQYWVCHLCHQQREQTSFYSEAAFKIDTTRCACCFLPCLPFLLSETGVYWVECTNCFRKKVNILHTSSQKVRSLLYTDSLPVLLLLRNGGSSSGCDRFRQTIHIPPCPSPNLDKPYFSISIHHSSRDEVILNLPTTVMAIHSSLDIFWREALLQLMLPLVGQL